MRYSEENKLAPAAAQLSKAFHKGKLTYNLPKQTLFLFVAICCLLIFLMKMTVESNQEHCYHIRKNKLSSSDQKKGYFWSNTCVYNIKKKI